MRAVIQRVSQASVRVDGEIIGAVGQGYLVLLGVMKGDTAEDVDYLAGKTAALRCFPDEEGRMNLALSDIEGAALVVSQFTLGADCRKGRRPGFSDTAPAAEANQLYLDYVAALRRLGVPVETGRFQAMMEVSLVNDGPVTFLLDSRRQF